MVGVAFDRDLGPRAAVAVGPAVLPVPVPASSPSGTAASRPAGVDGHQSMPDVDVDADAPWSRLRARPGPWPSRRRRNGRPWGSGPTRSPSTCRNVTSLSTRRGLVAVRRAVDRAETVALLGPRRRRHPTLHRLVTAGPHVRRRGRLSPFSPLCPRQAAPRRCSEGACLEGHGCRPYVQAAPRARRPLWW